MPKRFYLLFTLVLSLIVLSCGDSSTESGSAPELLLSADGLVEHLGGDCSAVQIRTRSLGSADLAQFSKLKIEINGSSDADLSSIQMYYVSNDEQMFILDLRNRDEINNTQSIEVTSPDHAGELFTRVTLKSSVCTGQIYYLTLRDVRVYGIK